MGKAQRALNRALDQRDIIENILSDPWTRRYMRDSAIEFLESLLRKDRFYLYSKDQIRVLNEIIEEMKPFGGFGGLPLNQLIDIAIFCKADCRYPETEDFIDELALERPTELPLHVLRYLIAVCRYRIWLPDLDGEFAPPVDPGDEEDRQVRAEAAADRWVSALRASAS